MSCVGSRHYSKGPYKNVQRKNGFNVNEENTHIKIYLVSYIPGIYYSLVIRAYTRIYDTSTYVPGNVF